MLAIILIVFIAFIFFDIIRSKPTQGKIVFNISKAPYYPIGEKKIVSLKPESFYIAKVKERNIFRPVKEEKKVSLPLVSISLKERTKYLQVVGKTWGTFQEVMIKDTKEGRTYFLKAGDVIGATGIKVKEILQDKVILEAGDERTEI